MPNIKFYYAPGSCSLACHIVLQETGLEFEAIKNQVDSVRTQFVDGFSHINPKMRVPAIIIDGETITEVPAIMTAISNLAPEKHLLGKSPLQTTRVYEWMNWLSSSLHAEGFKPLFIPERQTDDRAAIDGIKAKALGTVRDRFDFIEGKLIDAFAVGGALTAVDPYLFVFYRWGNNSGIRMKEMYPKYTALVSNLVDGDSVKAALEFEKINSTL